MHFMLAGGGTGNLLYVLAGGGREYFVCVENICMCREYFACWLVENILYVLAGGGTGNLLIFWLLFSVPT